MKQAKFALGMAQHGVGALAARDAGYSAHTAKEMAWENLTKPHVVREIERLKAEYADLFGVTGERVIRELAQIAFADRSALVQGRRATDPSEFPPGLSSCIEGVKETEHGLEYRLAPKAKALEALAKHLGLFEADNKQMGAAAADAAAVGDLEFARRLVWVLEQGATNNNQETAQCVSSATGHC